MSKLLQNYRGECEDFIKGWIKKKTRFNHKNLALENYKNFELEFEVSVENALKVSFKQESLIGKKGDKKDKICTSQTSYEKAVQNFIDETRKDEKNFDLLFKALKNGAFGLYTNQTQILEKNNKIIYQCKCASCRGSGSSPCSCGNGKMRCSCDNGKVKCSAWGCKNGRVKCSAWGCRDGRIEKSKYDYKLKTQIKTYETCSNCRGTGFVICSKCKGAVYITCSRCGGSAILTCNRCNGRGHIRCKNCDATGFISEITTVFVETQPSYKFHFSDKFDEDLKAKITEFGIENLGKIAEISRTKIEKDEKAKIVREKYTLTLPVAEFSLQLKKKSYEWAVFGREIQVLKNGGVPEKNDALVFGVTILLLIVAFFVYVNNPQIFITQKNPAKSEQNATNLDEKQRTKNKILREKK